MTDDRPSVVHVVDDDESIRTALMRLLRAAGYEVHSYASAADFQQRPRQDRPECVVLDVRLPGVTGLDLQETLSRSDDEIPIVFLTGYGDISMSVHAMKSGAVDFLTKPAERGVLLNAVSGALSRSASARTERQRVRTLRERYQTLTPREREVLAHVVAGELNKQIAYDLGTAERTVKAHRHNVMEKMHATSLAELVRMAQALGVTSDGIFL